MKALVAGATGQTGRRIVQALVERQIPVRALVRDQTTARDILPPSVELVVGDVLDRNTLYAAMDGCTVLLCATGATPSLDPTQPFKVDYEGTKNLVDVAKAQGIQHFVLVSSLCVSRFFHPLNLFWLILFWKQQAENYLQQSGLTYTIVRPGGLKNEEDTLGICLQGADTLFEGSIPRTKVAAVCVEALFQSDARNKIAEIVTREDQPNRDIAELFSTL